MGCRRLCGTGVFAHVRPEEGRVCGGDACMGGRLRLCRWREAHGVCRGMRLCGPRAHVRVVTTRA